MIILSKELISIIVKWGYRQWPISDELPRKLSLVVHKLDHTLPVMQDVLDIQQFVSDTIDRIPEIREWNLSANEVERGISVDDPNREKYSFSSRKWGPNLMDDFVDLDALKRNICQELIQSDLEVRNRK